jgi:hypothetical protein
MLNEVFLIIIGAGISLISSLASYWMFCWQQGRRDDLRKTALEIMDRMVPGSPGRASNNYQPIPTLSNKKIL